jgi:hypothetical protein
MRVGGVAAEKREEPDTHSFSLGDGQSRARPYRGQA